MSKTTPTILIVEDEPPLAELERIAIEGGDYRVLEVGRGDRGLEILEREQISLVLLDYKLPDMTGLDFIGAIGDRIKSLPVIMVTGYADTKVAVKLLKAGAADYVIKDTELLFLQQLPKTVKDTLERFNLRSENEAAKARIEKQTRDLLTQAKDLEEAKKQADQVRKLVGMVD